MSRTTWPGTPDPWDDWCEEQAEPPMLTVDMTENPVVAELLGPDGEVLRQWLEREPIGFRLRTED